MAKLFRFLFLATIGVAVAATASMAVLDHHVHQELAMGEEPMLFEVRPGESLRAIATALAQQGILARPRAFTWYARLKGLSGRVQAGEYEISPGTTPAGLLQQLVDGRVFLYSLTVVEGWTFKEMLDGIQSHPAIVAELDPTATDAIMPIVTGSERPPEGLFFPDTYRFARKTRDITLLRQSYERMQQYLNEVWEKRAMELPFETTYEALILASIVEKETALASERGRIAGVFVRRLRLGMRLQSDPTVIYGMGERYQGDIRSRDLRHDTPYNTYTRAGLPPTPIALPGAASIRAVLQPEETDALYFVASGDGDGSHVFSATLEEHNRAVQRYLARIREQRAAER